MKRVNHITWSFGLSLWIYYFAFDFNLFITTLFSFFTAAFAWLPDIDIRIVNLSREIMYKTLFLAFPVYLFMRILFKHRTITHTLWLPILFFSVYFYFDLFFLFEDILLILGMAISLHILEDSLTVTGVQPFFPISLKFRFGDFSTSSTLHFIFLEIMSFLIVSSFIFVWIYQFF